MEKGPFMTEEQISQLIDSGQIHPTHEGCIFVINVLRGKGVGPSMEEMMEEFGKRGGGQESSGITGVRR